MFEPKMVYKYIGQDFLERIPFFSLSYQQFPSMSCIILPLCALLLNISLPSEKFPLLLIEKKKNTSLTNIQKHMGTEPIKKQQRRHVSLVSQKCHIESIVVRTKVGFDFYEKMTWVCWKNISRLFLTFFY